MMKPVGAYRANYEQRARERKARQQQEVKNQKDKEIKTVKRGLSTSRLDSTRDLSPSKEKENMHNQKVSPGAVAHSSVSSSVTVDPPHASAIPSAYGNRKVTPKRSERKTRYNSASEREHPSTGQDRSQVVLTNGNGMGLWCHVKQSDAPQESRLNNQRSDADMLPPINRRKTTPQFAKKGAVPGSTCGVSGKEAPQTTHLTAHIEERVEKSLLEMLEKRCSELTMKVEEDEHVRTRLEFETNVAKKEREKYFAMVQELQAQNSELNERVGEMSAHTQSAQGDRNTAQRELQKKQH